MCQGDVKVGDRALWSLVNKQQIWCQGCASKMGFTDNKGRAVAEERPTTEASQRQSREEEIRKAHTENITATYALVKAVNDMTTELKNINYHLTVRP